jgi:hypothetical protein
MVPEKCPFCGQEIEAGSVKCFFCGKSLDKEAVEERIEQLEAEDLKESGKWAGHHTLLLLCVILFVVFIAVCPRSTDKAQRSGIITNIAMTRLNAQVTLTDAQLTITNNDTFDWKNIELRISTDVTGSSFSLKVDSIPAGQNFSAGITSFTDINGTRFSVNTGKPQKLTIFCVNPAGAACSYTLDLSKIQLGQGI